MSPGGANFLWSLPTYGDLRYLGATTGTRPASLRYLQQVAQAADSLNYFGVLLPAGHTSEDSWLVASSLVPVTDRLRFLVSVQPGLLSPILAARMTASLDRLSGGRLLINVVTDDDPVESKRDGVLDQDERYAAAREFLVIYRRLLAGKEVASHGWHAFGETEKLLIPPLQDYGPPLYFGESASAGIDVAAEAVDKYFTWGGPPARIAEKIAAVSAAAYQKGRRVTFGIRLHVIVRETNDEAWAAADSLMNHLDAKTVALADQKLARMDPAAWQCMTPLHGARCDRLEISPNLWTGVGLISDGAGTALIGDPRTVAARIAEYQSLGIDTFILSGYPHLEEAYRFAELVFPHLRIAEPDLDDLSVGQIAPNSYRAAGTRFGAA